jgi:hypothetical protein
MPGARAQRRWPVELVFLALLLVCGRVQRGRTPGWRRRLCQERWPWPQQPVLLPDLPERVCIPGQRW